MTRNVVLPALARLAASLGALLLLLAGQALGGDRASLNVLGYSDDGRYFAYEEYGVFDGAGGNYATVYLIDLETDAWVGKPFTAEEGGDTDDTPPIAETRARTMALAAPLLAKYRIRNPAEVMALLGDGVPDQDGKSMSFADTVCCGPGRTDERLQQLELETFKAAAADPSCEGMDVLGYALTYSFEGRSTELHRDAGKVPQSRRCPLDYRLYAVLSPFDAGSGPWIAMISYYPMGFEGPDRRFLAVPINAP